MLLNFWHLCANQIQIKQYCLYSTNSIFSNSFIKKHMKDLFYNISKCLSPVMLKSIYHYSKLLPFDIILRQINLKCKDLPKINCKSYLQLTNIFDKYINNFQLESKSLNNNRIFHLMNYNKLINESLYALKVTSIKNIIKGIKKKEVNIKEYVSQLHINVNYYKEIKFNMSNNNLSSSLLLKSKIMEKVRKKKRKIALLLAGGCLSCKKSKQNEQKLIEEVEEYDQSQKNDRVENSTEVEESHSIIKKDEILVHDTIKDLNLSSKNDIEIISNTFKHSIIDKSVEQISLEGNKEQNILTELPFGVDICIESNENINDLNAKDFPDEQQKKKNKFKQQEKKSLKKEERESKKRPNHFVAIQISNSKIKNSVKNIQNQIVLKENKLEPALINLKTLHITLLVCHISNNEELERACSALSDSVEILKEDFFSKPFELYFEGLDNFNNKVIFVKILENTREQLTHIAEEIIKSFESYNIEVLDKKMFNPHLTILKLSKSPKLLKKGIRKVDFSLYREFKNEHFGIEIVKGLQLLDMRRKDDDGYYYRCKEILFDNSTENCLEDSDQKINENPSLALQIEKKNIREKISLLTSSQLKKL